MDKIVNKRPIVIAIVGGLSIDDTIRLAQTNKDWYRVITQIWSIRKGGKSYSNLGLVKWINNQGDFTITNCKWCGLVIGNHECVVDKIVSGVAIGWVKCFNCVFCKRIHVSDCGQIYMCERCFTKCTNRDRFVNVGGTYCVDCAKEL
jgi:hypothetical protein